MKNLIYRDASLQDLPEVVKIYNSTIPSARVTADTKPVMVESRMAWFSDHIPGKRPLWIVENPDQKMIGWVSFQSFYGRPAYDQTAEISIYLDELWRGRGYGKKILEHVISSAPQFGIKTLLGFILAHNEPSIKLFRQAGFHEWGLLPDVAILNGVERGLMIFGKRVA
jgi:phosphinothricin acetyltransferase